MKKDIIDPDTSGFKNEKFFSIAILVLIIIAVGGFAILRSDAELDMELLRGEVGVEEAEDVEAEAEEDGQESFEIVENEEGDEHEDEDEDETDPEEVEPIMEEVEEDEVDYDGPAYGVEAQAGDGLTHVARRALQAHLQRRGNSDLTEEHKVFIEDYVQRRLDHSTGWLELGESVQVSQSLLDEAIEEANQLTESQLENLSQYTLS